MQQSSPNEKGTVEAAAHDAICAGQIALPDAQHRIATDWYQLGNDRSCDTGVGAPEVIAAVVLCQEPGPTWCWSSLSRSWRRARARVGPIPPSGMPAMRAASA